MLSRLTKERILTTLLDTLCQDLSPKGRKAVMDRMMVADCYETKTHCTYTTLIGAQGLDKDIEFLENAFLYGGYNLKTKSGRAKIVRIIKKNPPVIRRNQENQKQQK